MVLIMKAKPLKKVGDSYVECEVEESTHIMLNLPGPISTRLLPIIRKGTRAGTHCWSWNGDTDFPTLKPSILNDFRPHDTLVCHTWITDGKVIFLDDCSHEWRGQTLDLLEIE